MVNRGYQAEDEAAIDYQLWKLPGLEFELRGPRHANLPDRYFVAIGAAQTFGRFTPRPYSQIVAERLGLPGLNLGFSGAGPSFFSRRPELLDVINRAEFAIVQLLSGRSVSNSRFAVQINQGLVRPRGAGEDVAPVFAEDAYRRLLREETVEEIARLRAEIRAVYIAETRALLAKITVPQILMYWSVRAPDYQEGIGNIGAYWGDFPHFVNSAVISAISGYADRYVEVVTKRGLPQLITDHTGKPLLMWPEDRFPDVKLRSHNHYYPSPEMHADAAEALLRVLPVTRTPRSRPKRRDVLVHVHIFKNAGTSIDNTLQQYFGAAWMRVNPAAADACLVNADLTRHLTAHAEVAALSSHQMRFPLSGDAEIRLHPFLLLRHPIDRARSIYDYERMDARQQTSQLAHTVEAARRSFPEWIEWCLSHPALEAPIGNNQTRACSFRHNGSAPGDWDIRPDIVNLTEALAVMSELPVVGVVEEFDLTAALLTAHFASLFPGLRFASVQTNVSWEAQGVSMVEADFALDRNTLNDRLASVRAELGGPLYRRLVEANELDLELYAHAKRRLELLS